MPRWPERPFAGVGLLLTLGCLPAQAPAVTDFRAPDGSRFLLLPTAGAPVVHWVIATPASSSDEPPGMNSLNLANAMASLRGTWTTGSRDAEAEKQALAAVDVALLAQDAVRGGSEAVRGNASEQLERARTAAAVLSDPLAFRRVLAGAPAEAPAVQIMPGCLLFSCTTTAGGVERVARLLVERREQCALRGLDAEFETLQAAAIARWDADPMSPLRAEALALAFAGHPLAHVAARPGNKPPDRALALAAWQRTQRPDRSVHVLTGNFDPAMLRPLLERAFAESALRDGGGAPPPPPPSQATRRSTVPAGNEAACVIGWRLAGMEDEVALATAARWLGQGPTSWLQRQLRQRGRARAEVVCRGHWPDPAGPGLFLVEVREPGSTAPGLADLVLALCGEAAHAQPDKELAVMMQQEALRQREEEIGNPMRHAQRIAAWALLHPDLQVPPPPPAPVSPAAIASLLGALQQQAPPVVVERGQP